MQRKSKQIGKIAIASIHHVAGVVAKYVSLQLCIL